MASLNASGNNYRKGIAADIMIDNKPDVSYKPSGNSRPKVIVGIPCFNTSSYIADVVSRAKKHADVVIVVDDGSTDATASTAEAAGAQVIRHRANCGYGESIKTCLEAARLSQADILVTLDGDGQHDPNDLPRMLAPILKEEADLVIGSRFLSSENNMPRYRRFGINIITFLCNIGAKTKVGDAQSGFRAYNRKAISTLSINDKGMGASIELIFKAQHNDLCLRDVPINCYYHSEGSVVHPIRHGFSVVAAILKHRLLTTRSATRNDNLETLQKKEDLGQNEDTFDGKSQKISSGVSITIPAHNAVRTISNCISAAINQQWPGDLEVIVVNDHSTDETAAIAMSFPRVRVINSPHRGFSQTRNIGINAASYDIVVTLDSDAILRKDWLSKIVPYFDEPNVAAVAGYAITGNKSIIGRMMGYDVESRLDRMVNYTDHLYTMNTAFRRRVLFEVGLFDESLGGAEDADMSRKLVNKGYQLLLSKDACCTHYWRDDYIGYMKQQYNYAYSRLELIPKTMKVNDRVAGWGMTLHVPFTALVLLSATAGFLVFPLAPLFLISLPLVHLPQAVRLMKKRKEPGILALPFIFTIRNFTWTWAAVVWTIRQVLKKIGDQIS